METSIVVNLIFAFILVGYILKPKLKTLALKAKAKLIQGDSLKEVFAEHEFHSGNRYQQTRAELNHIKGQLQELLQGQKAGQDPRIAEINGDVKALFERLNMVAKQVSDAQGSVEYVEAAVKAEAERNSTKLYSEGLAGLANACSAILERQVASEKLLSDIVNVLTQRND